MPNMAVEILRLTKNGDNLLPQHLELVERCAMGSTDQDENLALEQLGQLVRSGHYCFSSVPGFDDLSVNAGGYLYYKGIEVDGRVDLDTQGGIKAVLRTGYRCRHLETLGVNLSPKSVTCYWSWFETLDHGNPYLPFLACIPEIWERGGELLILLDKKIFRCCSGRVCRDLGMELWIQRERSKLPGVSDQRLLMDQGCVVPDVGQGRHLGICYASGVDLVEYLVGKGLPSDFF